MKKILSILFAAAFALSSGGAEKQPLRKQLFDSGWQFSRDSMVWQNVDLPHDWSIEGPFDRDAPAGNDGGYLPTGKGWYRKELRVKNEELRVKNEELRVKNRLRLYFEGVYMNSEVYVNGQLAGGHPYGYSSFFVDITPYVVAGINRIEVRVDNSKQKNCRWYSGSGIYRHVWLMTTGMNYIDEWSVSVTTPDIHTVCISGELVREDGRREPLSKTIHVENPRLWSPDDPFLYETTLEAEGDAVPVTYGIRTIEWSAGKGLLLNGKNILLNGGCVHHDNGILGAAAYDDAEYRKARLMKEAGFNAVRTSHNPPSEAFLRACDELGLLVIDEVFDGWRDKKNTYDYATLIDQWWQEDIKAMVLRDRNHPSVFCWSIGNEVIERKKIEVVRTASRMAGLCRELDPERRPVTSALAAWDSDWDIYDPLAAQHDIVGYNYMIHKAESDHERVPSRVMMQTESYPRDVWQNYRMTTDHSYIVGDFVWTAIDYLGESGIGRWYYEGDPAGEHWERRLYPWHGAYCGDIDLTGHRKPVSHYRSMLWNRDGEHLYMAVREPDGYNGKVKTTRWGTWPTFESWNWPGHEGKPIEVVVCSHYPRVKLYLNGELIAEKPVSEGMALFRMNYQPGVLRAEGVSKTEAGETVSLHTAGNPCMIRLTAEPANCNGNGASLVFVNVEMLDKDGHLNPMADTQLTASVTGPAEVIAFGNADIKDCDVLTDNRQRTWKGRALLVLKTKGKAGKITVKVQGEGLKQASFTLEPCRNKAKGR